MKRLVCAVTIALLAASLAGTVLAQEHQVQRGIKTSQPGYALALDVTIPMDDMGRAGEIMEQAYDDIFAIAEAEQYTALGQMYIVMTSLMPVDGKIPFQVLLLVAEQPAADELDSDTMPKVVQLEAQQVAYTYHKGALDQLQMTFMGLFTWIGGQGLQMAGAPRMVIHPDPGGGEPQVAELQIPVK